MFSLWIVSNADNDTAEVYEARTGGIIALLEDRRAAKLALNAPASGQPDTRAVKDFHIFDYFLKKSDQGRHENKWIGEVELNVICQGMGVPAT